ncbi:hypothetical protein L202_01535 [Cryptococcus amylolentus CBS 6039]|uniref:AB hydrolase-1 domain-containing protein n=2 Tax=Cryptococcus amylolentus TaxID=104669 RepID=A0A1E3I6G0_9TREE|nr:hypothetical protein L202_01535 [Cryptococcus amylolentus CBS 6039]ODN83391.1 hypothetical protein L202_01535 [Cryptococcus amylolentus CBS 6039]ODO10920.1 hypothetical protein I350_01519 [Cryptococcus amylolentus CBS 6273]
MPTYIDIPSAPKRLAYVLSTPGKRVATEIDPAFPTVFLCHPPTACGYYYYYALLEDPSLNEHYNLLTIDIPGHGASRMKEPLEGEITWARIAMLFHEALQAFGVKKAHIVGSDMGGQAALSMALAHPEMVESLIMLRPNGRPEPEIVARGFVEWFAVSPELIETRDLDLIDILVSILLEFVTGQMTNWILRDICEGLGDLCKAKFLRGEYEAFHSVFFPLLVNSVVPSAEDLTKMDFPTLVIEDVVHMEGDEDGQDLIPENKVWADIIDKLNGLAASRGKRPLAARHALVGEGLNKYGAVSRWTALTHPGLVTPMIKDFVENTTTSSLFSNTESTLGRCQPREPKYPPDFGNLLDILQESSVASSSQAETKTWADLVSEMQQGEASAVQVEVEE